MQGGQKGAVLQLSRLVLLCLLILLPRGAAPCFGADGPATGEPPAAQLMGKKLYADAARLLESELKNAPDENNGARYLMLGECYYQQSKYGDARPWFLKAFQSLPPGKNKIS